MELTLGEWRRCGSVTTGALVLMLQDLWPGAGWGLIDSLGEPKSPWYALKRACRPLQVLLSDEGLEGLAVHVVNETNVARTLRPSLQCLRRGATPVIDTQTDIELGPRSALRMTSTQIIGSFFDITNAYRFGPPAHDVTIATSGRWSPTICSATTTAISTNGRYLWDWTLGPCQGRPASG